jgi:hypothetical protein
MAIASPQRGLSGVGFFESSHDYSFALFIDLTMTWITSGERRYVSPVDQRRQEVHDGYLLVVTDSVDGLKWVECRPRSTNLRQWIGFQSTN